VERSLTAPAGEGQGHLAAVKAANIHMPRRFVLTATFIEPKKVSLIPNQRPPQGTFAAAVLLSFGRTSSAGSTNLTGASSQLRGTGQRLNATGIAVPANRPNIPANLSKKVLDPQNPSLFTLVLHVDRSAANSQGDAKLFVGTDAADSFHFTFGNGLTSATVFDSIRIGITTVNGTNYEVSVFMTEFEIWAPIPATPNKSLDASGGSVFRN
jgi:hypothetical protein